MPLAISLTPTRAVLVCAFRRCFPSPLCQTLCITSAKAIGVKVTNVGASELIEGEKFPSIVLGLIWQLVKAHLLNSINLKNHPELVRLLEDGETLGM